MLESPWGRLGVALSLGLLLSVMIERWVQPRPDFRHRSWSAWRLHVGSVLLGIVATLALSQRPLFGAALALTLWGLLVAVNNAKFRALREPFVFSDFALFSQALRFPRLYLPFLGLWETAGGGLIASVVYYFGVMTETSVLPAFGSGNFTLMIAAGGVVAAILLWTGIRGSPAPCLEPDRDVRHLGLLPSLWLYRIVEAKPLASTPRSPYGFPTLLERPDRNRQRRQQLPHLIVVQSESFFDARRMMSGIRPDVLRYFDTAKGTGWSGQLTVPAWGANTMRTEFSFLSGIPAHSLGIHRFNPYRRFARRPVPGIAWYLRAMGYRTLCIHPHPAGFFGRDQVYPYLGFDRFIDIDGFSGAERFGPYVADAAVAESIAASLAVEKGPVFIFAITMENHGPLHLERVSPADRDAFFSSPPPRGFDDLTVYLRHLANADRMLGQMLARLEISEQESVVCFFGDHVPSLPGVYRELDYRDARTDYLLWRRGLPAAVELDLEVDALGLCLLDIAGIRPQASSIQSRQSDQS